MPDDSGSRPARWRYGRAALLADPSEDAVAGADDVVTLEKQVQALGLRQQKEEKLDWFRDREEREAQGRVAQEREEQGAAPTSRSGPRAPGVDRPMDRVCPGHPTLRLPARVPA